MLLQRSPVIYPFHELWFCGNHVLRAPPSRRWYISTLNSSVVQRRIVLLFIMTIAFTIGFPLCCASLQWWGWWWDSLTCSSSDTSCVKLCPARWRRKSSGDLPIMTTKGGVKTRLGCNRFAVWCHFEECLAEWDLLLFFYGVVLWAVWLARIFGLLRFDVHSQWDPILPTLWWASYLRLSITFRWCLLCFIDGATNIDGELVTTIR